MALFSRVLGGWFALIRFFLRFLTFLGRVLRFGIFFVFVLIAWLLLILLVFYLLHDLLDIFQILAGLDIIRIEFQRLFIILYGIFISLFSKIGIAEIVIGFLPKQFVFGFEGFLIALGG